MEVTTEQQSGFNQHSSTRQLTPVPVGGINSLSTVDWPNKITAVVYLVGCTWRCPYCHNRSLWPLSVAKPPPHTIKKILEFMSQRQGNLKGMVITGGEPTLQDELSEFLQELKRMGFSVKLDTNGSRPEVVAALLADGLIDYIAMDIKAPFEKYASLCGRHVNTDEINSSITIVASGGVPFHFRTTFFRPLLVESDLESIRMILPSNVKHVIQACLES